MGITGANFLISDSGSTVIVTNEGNGRMTNTLPKVHVAVTSIEKCISNFEELSLMLRVLTRSATSQNIVIIYLLQLAKKTKELDGPKEFHVILMDVGRTKILESETWEILKCIRCGACMNHCPVTTQLVDIHMVGFILVPWVQFLILLYLVIKLLEIYHMPQPYVISVALSVLLKYLFLN